MVLRLIMGYFGVMDLEINSVALAFYLHSQKGWIDLKLYSLSLTTHGLRYVGLLLTYTIVLACTFTGICIVGYFTQSHISHTQNSQSHHTLLKRCTF